MDKYIFKNKKELDNFVKSFVGKPVKLDNEEIGIISKSWINNYGSICAEYKITSNKLFNSIVEVIMFSKMMYEVNE